MRVPGRIEGMLSLDQLRADADGGEINGMSRTAVEAQSAPALR